jgi:hypothetical protein
MRCTNTFLDGETIIVQRSLKIYDIEVLTQLHLKNISYRLENTLYCANREERVSESASIQCVFSVNTPIQKKAAYLENEESI